MTLIEKIMAKVVVVDGHWVWQGATTSAGYGHVWWEGKLIYTHRAVWEHHHGSVPPGLQIDHTCRVPACCNPDIKHTEPVTQLVNILRGESPAAKHARQTACARGHEWSPETIYWRNHRNGRKTRQCRLCARENDAKRRVSR